MMKIWNRSKNWNSSEIHWLLLNENKKIDTTAGVGGAGAGTGTIVRPIAAIAGVRVAAFGEMFRWIKLMTQNEIEIINHLIQILK